MAATIYDRAASAANKRSAGRGFDVTLEERLALARVQADLGLDRPLESYAPRTRRRYLSAARKGESASTARQRERTARRAKQPRSARSEALALAAQLRTATLESAPEWYEPDAINEMLRVYGPEGVRDILAMQIDSVTQYADGNKSPGNRRWYARRDIVERYYRGLGPTVTDPYFYYHGSLS